MSVTLKPVAEDADTSGLSIICDDSECCGFDEMVIRLDRYYSRGEMAGDIAHEINNYLAIISGNIELIPLMLKRGQMDKLAQKTEVMRQSIERISMLCDGLMDHQADGMNLSAVDMNQLILNLLSFLKPQNRLDGVTIDTRLSADLPAVELDAAQIRQAILNLLNNAADALYESRGEKRITISTMVSPQGEENWAYIEVADTGDGVPANHLTDLFVKRFTTKPRGLGIGLIACRRIAERHCGKLRYHFDAGSRFSIELPLSQPQCVKTLSAPVSESIPVTC